jgi:hypothetical protein
MIAADMPTALAVHALSDLERRPPDVAQLRSAYAEAEAALAAFAAALEDPLAEIGPLARRAHVAALVLRATLAAMPQTFASQRQTAERMIETFEPFVRRGVNSDDISREATVFGTRR